MILRYVRFIKYSNGKSSTYTVFCITKKFKQGNSHNTVKDDFFHGHTGVLVEDVEYMFPNLLQLSWFQESRLIQEFGK